MLTVRSIHNRHSIRLKGYDYSQAGLYFITICCHDKMRLFGEIENGGMKLNDAGIIADECWKEIPMHFPDAVLHEYIIMPNHIHGIIELKQKNINNTDVGFEKTVVGIENFQSLQHQNKFQKMIPRSIGSIIKGFKIGVTKWFRSNTEIVTIWQRNYYEHIIRNRKSYQTISEYIINNPAKWKKDKLNTK